MLLTLCCAAEVVSREACVCVCVCVCVCAPLYVCVCVPLCVCCVIGWVPSS